ncbi:MAG: hypothetical protein CL609_10805 [Anaerolineaceae bacterium]|nr:hypothetical protein [Anaerolineaceae bacterium]
MSRDFRLNNDIEIEGPFWRARAKIVRANDPHTHWQVRPIFVSNFPNRRFGATRNLSLPGTMLLLCRVHQVELRLSNSFRFRWINQHSLPADLDQQIEMDQYLDNGTLSLLVVEANPESIRSAQNPFGQSSFRCISGEIKLNQFSSVQNSTQNLFNTMKIGSQDGQPRIFEVSASGLTLSATIFLPWRGQADPLGATFLLARTYDHRETEIDTIKQNRFRLEVAPERLTKEEKGDILDAWGKLSAILNPENPLNAVVVKDASSPSWSTLGVVDPTRVPKFHLPYDFDQAIQTQPQIIFGPGEFNFILSNAHLYDPDTPSTTTAIIPFEELVIGKEESEEAGNSETISIKLGVSTSNIETERQWHYHAALDTEQNHWLEVVSIQQIDLSVDGLEIARHLRKIHGVPIPTWTQNDPPIPLETPLLWGALPLEDGWMQIPFLNLTEQILVEADMISLQETMDAQSATESIRLIQGALTLGNKNRPDLSRETDEIPWDASLIGGDGITAHWTLTKNNSDSPWKLTSVQVTVFNPQLVIDGLIWLSQEAPSIRHALPELDNWINGLVPFTLETVPEKKKLFNPPLTVHLDTLQFERRLEDPFDSDRVGDASLQESSLRMGLNEPAIRDIIEIGILPEDWHFSKEMSPLIWRRHPSLPVIQALPLTQSQTPPNYPSTERGLIPFELKNREEWHLQTEARQWGHLPDKVEIVAANAWKANADLPIAFLSMPGLILDPNTPNWFADSDLTESLKLQWRYDVPTTDELNALAQLAKQKQDGEHVSPYPDDLPPEKLAPLMPGRFADHWQALSRLASLAALEGVDAFRRETDEIHIQNLIEPHTWPVQVDVNLKSYPGSITLDNKADDSHPLLLEGETGLEGISGWFKLDSERLVHVLPSSLTEGDLQFEVTANSMVAAIFDGFIRDQRGLWRTHSVETDQLLETQIRLDEAQTPIILASTRQSVILHLSERDAAPINWFIWFRDVPLEEGQFSREETLSDIQIAEDINDPDSDRRDVDFKQGYEWRLEDPSLLHLSSEDPWLNFFNLNFFPLTLETVEQEEGVLQAIEIIGRLQLPLDGKRSEVTALTNAVHLRFELESAGVLGLKTIQLVEGLAFAEWPLALIKGEPADVPRIIWNSIQYDSDSQHIVVEDALLQFTAFDVPWSVPLDPLTFDFTSETQTFETVLTPDRPVGVYPNTLELTLNLPASTGESVTLSHQANLELGLSINGKLGHIIEASFAYNLLQRSDPGDIREATLFERIALIPSADHLDISPQTIQFDWEMFESLDAEEILHWLPGILIAPDDPNATPRQYPSPGWISITFKAIASPSTVTRIPSFTIQSGFLELLVNCAWGTFLQSDPPPLLGNNQDPLFNSSAGQLAIGYTAEWFGDVGDEMPWLEHMLLNGTLEVKSLFSWPTGLSYSEATSSLTFPAFKTLEGLSHYRHTIHILFNQHDLPLELLVRGTNGMLFDFDPRNVWRPLAIIEHQLAVILDQSDENIQFGSIRRWTALQEIRIATSAAFKRFLSGSRFNPTEHFIDPSAFLSDLTILDGYYETTIRNSWLTIGDPPPTGVLWVEASAPFWVKEQVDSSESKISRSPLTTLQYLPGGNQRVTLSQLSDFQSEEFEATNSRPWNFIVMPFLGRLQPEGRDGLGAGLDQTNHPFEVDPVLQLKRLSDANNLDSSNDHYQLLLQLTSRGDGSPVIVPNLSRFDTSGGRRFARLDPASIQENWFRLLYPLEEASASVNRLTSILETYQDTSARLSRPTSLYQAFDSFRLAYPPALPDAPIDRNVVQDSLGWDPGADRLLWLRGDERSRHAAPRFAWQQTALLIATGIFAPTTDSGQDRLTVRRHLAGTLHPTEADRDNKTNLMPIAFSISPYSGLSLKRHDPADAQQLKLVSVELLSLVPDGRRLRLTPIASILREIHAEWMTEHDGETPLTQDEIVDAITHRWVLKTHEHLTPDSPIATLRIREIYSELNEADHLQVNYRFKVFTGLKRREKLTQRHAALRHKISTLRFRDGRFGGTQLPRDVEAFELAPPMTTGAQPIYLKDGFDSNWWWGFSGIRLVHQMTKGRQGVIGKAIQSDSSSELLLSFWWQAVQHRIQFRKAQPADGRPTAGLPALFRAEAIRHMLPILPDPPLPLTIHLKGDESEEDEGSTNPAPWQPIMPGGFDIILTGNRSGGFFAIRTQIIRQTVRFSEQNGHPALTHHRHLVSGSLPIQHRFPRPVPLPPFEVDKHSSPVGQAEESHQPVNHNKEIARHYAIQPWASWFDPATNHYQSVNPADEAFYAACGDKEAKRMRLELFEPARGELHPSQLPNQFKLRWKTNPDKIDGWHVSAKVQGTSTVELNPLEEGCAPGELCFAPETPMTLGNGNASRSDLQRLVDNMEAGDTCTLIVTVSVDERFEQTLTFPLRKNDPKRPRLPLEPRFILFEDPEYNRALSTLSGRAVKLVSEWRGDKLSNGEISLSTDRREYNLDSVITWRFDWDGDHPDDVVSQNGTPKRNPANVAGLAIEVINKNGIPFIFQNDALQFITEEDADGTKKLNDENKVFEMERLYGIALDQLKRNDNGEPIGSELIGSKIKLTLVLDVKTGLLDAAITKQEIVLLLDLVGEPVTPTPEAGYALLRAENEDGTKVSCRRFAWGPIASRIELVCADDLLQEVVRRRALFRWSDTAVVRTPAHYAVQKHTPDGATHFPPLGSESD